MAAMGRLIRAHHNPPARLIVASFNEILIKLATLLVLRR